MIHILFSESAAGTLKQLLRSRGVTDKVVALSEWLDWGWIASESGQDRVDWYREVAGYDWNWIVDAASTFPAEVAADDDQLIWIAPRSAQELCGLHWLMHHTDAPSSHMVVADRALEGAWRDGPPQGLGELGLEMMGELYDSAPRPELDCLRFPASKWRSLMDEGALVRVVKDGILQSARSDHFDDLLLRWCPLEWTKWSRVIGHALAHAGHHVSDLFLRWRLQELIATGQIECAGELPSWNEAINIRPAKVRRVS